MRAAPIVFFASLAGCSSLPLTAEQLGNSLEAPVVLWSEGRLAVQGLVKMATGPTVTVFIEGDGRPYAASGGKVAADPTQRSAPALRWFSAHPGASIYLIRPCYRERPMQAGCVPADWTLARYGHDVVDAMATWLNHWLKQNGNVHQVTLVGHSGGGVLAALLASRVTRVSRVVAVATPLDHSRWTAWHGYTPLAQSLNPADTKERGARQVPIELILGDRDENVPAKMFSSVEESRADIRIHVTDSDHDCCFDALVKRLLADPVAFSRAR